MAMRVSVSMVLAICVCLTCVTPISAKPHLREVAEIDDHIMSIAIADEIRKRCDGINARMIKALSVLHKLKRRAKQLGYSDDEIDDYVTSKAEKRRMRGKAEAWLAARDVDGNVTSELCMFGKDQIKAGGQVGELLR